MWIPFGRASPRTQFVVRTMFFMFVHALKAFNMYKHSSLIGSTSCFGQMKQQMSLSTFLASTYQEYPVSTRWIWPSLPPDCQVQKEKHPGLVPQ